MTARELSSKDPLTICDRQSLHDLGRVQSFGRLLVLDSERRNILGHSSNWGTALDDDVARARWIANLRALLPERLPEQAIDGLPIALEHGLRLWSALAHLAPDGRVLVDLEPEPRDTHADQELSAAALHGIRDLAGINDLDELVGRACEMVSRLTGFDRVMMYQFHGDGHGEVIGETLARRAWEPFLGLHYPASDIPQQARDLYLRNRLRLIVDARDEPVEVVGLGRAPDLTGSHLRSVSPIHLQYLNNMGVRASASMSLVVDGKLWGLIACHHASPKSLTARARSSLDLVARAVSDGISRCSHVHFAGAFKARLGLLNMMVQKAVQAEDSRFFVEGEQSVASIIPCDAVVLVEDSKVSRSTGCDQPGAVIEAVSELDLAPTGVYSSNASRPFFERTGMPGALVIPLSSDGSDFIVLLRRELDKEVRWAGRESVSRSELGADDPRRLEPRRSFEVFVEMARGTARPWSEIERELAESLRSLYLELWVGFLRRKTEALARRNYELAHALKSSSHDLRGALRVISYNMSFLGEAFEAGIAPDDRRLVEETERATLKIGALLDGFLELSVSNARSQPERFSPGQVIASVLADLRVHQPDAVFEIDSMPEEISFSPTHFTQIASNLMGNAIKYAGDSRKGVRYLPSPGTRWHAFQFWDEGPGIEPGDEQRIFEPFVRLARDGEGSGLGLDLVRSILGFYGGEVTVRPNEPKGTLFQIKIPKTTPRPGPLL